jgi:gluconokinase
MISGVSADIIREDADEQAPRVLALDIGTSSVRAALFDSLGNEIKGTAAHMARTLSTTLDGGAELNADEALEQVTRVVDAVLAQSAPASGSIETLAVSCFWHSLVGIDREGRAVTPVLGWADTRAARAVEELRRELDERETHARTGCPFHSSYWPAKLRWLQRERTRLYSAVHSWLSFGELLAMRFFGETDASLSMASATGLFDARLCQWDEPLLNWLGIDVNQLPAIACEQKSFSQLTPEYARRWPQLRRARMFPAIGDGAANNIGAGCLTRERVMLMIGTSGAMRALSEDDPPHALPESLWCYRADSRRILIGGALSDGGGLYAWMREALALGGAELEEIEGALSAMEPDAHGLTVLPFWAGERSTGWATTARGAILGLTMHTRPIEILRAAMESVAYRFALIARALDLFAPKAEIVASGGALRSSAVWAQMLADVLGRAVTLSGVRESSSRGAALLALEATGKIKSIADAQAPMGQAYEPDMSRHKRYRAGLERQQELYEHLVADRKIAGKISAARTSVGSGTNLGGHS